MRSAAARRLLALVLVAAVLAGAVGPAAGQAAGSEASLTTVRIALHVDGDARWTIVMRFPIRTANETAAFKQLAREFEGNRTDLLSSEPFRRAAPIASESAGRPMSIVDESRSAARTNDTGRLALSFTWTNFTRRADAKLLLGDVFHAPSGTWLPGLADRQVLIVEPPDGYVVESAQLRSSYTLENGSLRIPGPTRFDPGQPRVVFERTGPVDTPGTTSVTTATPTGGLDASTLLGVGAALVAVLLLAYLVSRRGGGAPEPDDQADPDGGPDDEAPPEPAEELLSDEERVLRLLRENGGRMKQVDIVEETDWSNAKVSQLLSEMDDDGRVNKLRIGRENLISLPDETPDEVE